MTVTSHFQHILVTTATPQPLAVTPTSTLADPPALATTHLLPVALDLPVRDTRRPCEPVIVTGSLTGHAWRVIRVVRRISTSRLFMVEGSVTGACCALFSGPSGAFGRRDYGFLSDNAGAHDAWMRLRSSPAHVQEWDSRSRGASVPDLRRARPTCPSAARTVHDNPPRDTGHFQFVHTLANTCCHLFGPRPPLWV